MLKMVTRNKNNKIQPIFFLYFLNCAVTSMNAESFLDAIKLIIKETDS